MQIDCFIVTDHSKQADQQALYKELKVEGYSPRFIEQRGTPGVEKAMRRSTTETLLVCWVGHSRQECSIISRVIREQ